MFASNEIKDYLEKYVINDGNVYLKDDNRLVVDENIILRVKSARLIYNEARVKYQSDIKQFGKSNGDFEKYITKVMEQLSVNGEVNSYGVNKFINGILTSNGHYEEYMSGNNLAESKFSILEGVKREYGIAYLRLKFREKGLDIENLTVKQDLSELQHNGVSKVIIDFQVNKYEKRDSVNKVNDGVKFFSYPKAELLNELEKQKNDALAHNDEVAYNYASVNIERIIRENPVEVSPEQWDLMGYDERKSFVLIKMKEAKVLNDEVSFNFWNSNLKQIEEKNMDNSFIISINNIRGEMNKLHGEYEEMLSDGIIDDGELDYLISRMHDLYSSVMVLKENNLSNKDYEVINGIVKLISEEENKMISFRNDTKRDVHHFGR